MYALTFAFFTSLVCENELVITKSFNRNFWDIVRKTNPQVLSLIPSVVRLLTQDHKSLEIPPSVKYINCGSSHLSKKHLLDFYNKFKIPILQSYGLSECVCLTNIFPHCDSETEYLSRIAKDEKSSVGPEIWGTNVFIVDADDKEVRDEMVEGEIVVRGWNLMEGYFDSPEQTKEVFRNDYLHTGDIGYFRIINEKKYFYVSGRKKEIVKIHGKPVYLNAIDDLLSQLNSILNVCSVRYLDEHEEEQLGIFAIVQPGKSPASVKLEITKTLPHIKVGKIIFGDELIVTGSGKKRREEMALRYFA